MIKRFIVQYLQINTTLAKERENHMITSIYAEKAFDEIDHSSSIKKLKVIIEGIY